MEAEHWAEAAPVQLGLDTGASVRGHPGYPVPVLTTCPLALRHNNCDRGKLDVHLENCGLEHRAPFPQWKVAHVPSNPDIRRAMSELAETLASPTSVPDALRVLTDGAVQAIPGADHASISVRHQDGRLETLAATDAVIVELDARQYDLQEGPCYHTVTHPEELVVTFDLGKDERWPRYGQLAAEAGIRAQLAAQLSTNGTGQRSALNVYSKSPHKFDHDSIETAEMFASHAAVAMGFVHTVENLGSSVSSRQMIGQAVGILMERYQLSESRAFAYLVRVSRDSNIKLRVVAAEIVTGLSDRNEIPSPD